MMKKLIDILSKHFPCEYSALLSLNDKIPETAGQKPEEVY
jgi:hypothetical protein